MQRIQKPLGRVFNVTSAVVLELHRWACSETDAFVWQCSCNITPLPSTPVVNNTSWQPGKKTPPTENRKKNTLFGHSEQPGGDSVFSSHWFLYVFQMSHYLFFIPATANLTCQECSQAFTLTFRSRTTSAALFLLGSRFASYNFEQASNLCKCLSAWLWGIEPCDPCTIHEIIMIMIII